MKLRLVSLFLACTLILPVAHAAAAEVDAASVAAALEAGSRSEKDRARDAGRKPAEVVAFLGIEPGLTVIDLIAAGGYYTEVLSLAVGPEGKVYAQNTEFTLKIRDGANDKEMTARLKDGRLPNVERIDHAISESGLAPGSVDAALTALNFHDIYNGRSPDAAESFLRDVRKVLKPGGILGIIDHQGIAGEDNERLHRIQEQYVVTSAKAAGFELVATGEMLRNPEDDHTRSVFAEGMRGKTDRFVLLFRKRGA